MDVRFWGVRGSVAVSGEGYRETGGNTSCLEVRHGEESLVLDGGTGIRALGEAIGFRPVTLPIVFSHVHWDHIQGIPFFLPAFHPGSRLILIGAENLASALADQMKPPTFPVTLSQIPARLEFRALSPGRELEVGPFRLQAHPLNHPNGVLAVRIQAGARSLVYATDHEHGRALDAGVVRFAQGADLLVHDAQYTVEEYEGRAGPPRRGWGHSCWDEAADAAAEAGAGKLALFHHDPGRRDDAVRRIEAQARGRFAAAFAAREGMAVAV